MYIKPKRKLHFTWKRHLWGCVVLCVLLLVDASCSSYKNIAYLKDIKDSVSNMPVASLHTIYADPKIQSNDLLQVTVQTLDPQANSLLSGNNNNNAIQQLQANMPVQPQQSANGYMVDKNGIIQLPLVGSVKVAGLTTTEARDLITERAAKYYKDPVVNVHISNFSITVLGEVSHPATYQVQNEKISILDALGMAGDLTIYGKRENIMLIRDENGDKKFVRFNINSSNIFSSPYFYLRQGDMVYVEPNKAKAANTDMAKTRNYTLLASAFTVLIVLLTRINF
ncbi:polysaccharide biosynthesis/export family protein [Chitinophagaceae bacterium MMS25-I14]